MDQQLFKTAFQLHQAGRLDEARQLYLTLLAKFPDHAETLHLLGALLHQSGSNQEAAGLIERAIRGNPVNPLFHYNLGAVYQALQQWEAAEASFRKALELNPRQAEAWFNLGMICLRQDKMEEAAGYYRQAISHKPGFVKAYISLAKVLSVLGKVEEAIASLRQALQLRPDDAMAYSNMLFQIAYHSILPGSEYLALARGWELACVPQPEREAARRRGFRREPLSGRRLRVGYVSGDFRQHAVSYFIEQTLAHHDRDRVELFAYTTTAEGDAVTERMRALVEHWVLVSGMADREMLARVEADAIDVLVDLSGHTALNRMGVFARRAAPVQLHYLGYFASTGLTEMDYFIGDEVLTPPETDAHFCERVWRLPRIRASYDGSAEAPEPAWRADASAAVCVGSFSNLNKLTPETFELWARVLRALPEARLLLKTRALSDPSNRRRILEQMTGLGIETERIELQSGEDTPDWKQHMAYYDRLDVVLDPVGAHGGYTTTCDALWMGAPVITLEGELMASRMTASLLAGIGQPDWIARSQEEYVDKVVNLARDVEGRAAMRWTQRARMSASPLCDARGLSNCLENAYVEMFETWLAHGRSGRE